MYFGKMTEQKKLISKYEKIFGYDPHDDNSGICETFSVNIW